MDWRNLLKTIGSEVNWSDVFKTIGSTAVVVGILGWVAQTSIKHFLDRDVETYKARLATNTERLERIRQEVLRWSNPILGGSVKDLRLRLENILDKRGYPALSRDSKTNPEWSIDYEYFLPSTVFLFGQYFCWVQLLEERLSFELFDDQAERDEFFSSVNEVGRMLADYPLSELKGISGTGDLQVFRLQQRGIGETLYVGDGANLRPMRYSEFVEKWQHDPDFKRRFDPLTRFLGNLDDKSTFRWKRLELMKHALQHLQSECERLLSGKRAQNRL